MPWGIYGSSYAVVTWLTFGHSYNSNVAAQDIEFNATQLPTADAVFSIAIYSALLIGSILLLTLHNHPKIGFYLIVTGFAFSLVYLAYLYMWVGGLLVIPIGFFISLAAAILAFRVKKAPPLLLTPKNEIPPIQNVSPQTSNLSETSIDNLVKLKELL